MALPIHPTILPWSIYHGRNFIKSLSDLKKSIERHVGNIPQLILPRTVEYEILRFQIVADNDGHHIDHVLQTFLYYLYVLSKAMIRHLGVVSETHCFLLPQ